MALATEADLLPEGDGRLESVVDVHVLDAYAYTSTGSETLPDRATDEGDEESSDVMTAMDESIQTFASQSSIATASSQVSSSSRRRHFWPSKSRRCNSMPLDVNRELTSQSAEQAMKRTPEKPSSSSKKEKGKRPFTRRWSFDIFRVSGSSNPLRREGSMNSSKSSTAEESNDDSSPLNTRESEDESRNLPLHTKIVPQTCVTPSEVATPEEDPVEPEEEMEAAENFTCSTAILQHSYLESICGNDTSIASEIAPSNVPISEDPTVQESIECIFESQLEEGLNLWNDEGEDIGESAQGQDMISPAAMLQTRGTRISATMPASSRKLSRSKMYRTASLKYMGTCNPENAVLPDNDVVHLPPDAACCPCHINRTVPTYGPQDWPQAPLMLRPSPNSNMIVKGIRFSGSEEYLWTPGSKLDWHKCLISKWDLEATDVQRSSQVYCERCALLPINNGNEKAGESLVVDFESNLFDGTLLMRIRHAEGSTRRPYDDSKGYFSGLNRRYQALVRGRFKKPIPFTQLTTGFKLQRACSKLPSKWIMRGGLKVLGFFAPQLDAKFEGPKPYCLTPLGSAPQSIAIDDGDPAERLEGAHEEPTEAHRTLLGERSLASSSVHRARARKKAFDKLYVRKAVEPKTDPSKIYTFEFLQHLFNFQDFSIELGSMLGSVNLGDVLGGQPMQFMAQHNGHILWAFDLWHQALWEPAMQHRLNTKTQQRK